MLSLPSTQYVHVAQSPVSSAIAGMLESADRPILFKALVADWSAVKAKMTDPASARGFLSRHWIADPLTAYVAESAVNGRFFYNDAFSGFNFQAGSAPLEQVLRRMEEQQTAAEPLSIYVGSTAVDRWLPGFREQNDLAWADRQSLVSFWLGNRSVVSAHYDFPDNLACVVAGQRRFILFPPEQVRNLYVGPIDRTPSGQAISLVDFNHIDHERFPLFEQALESALWCDCEPGDVLFIPGMWWHHVEAKADFNMLVNYWWLPEGATGMSPIDAMRHAMLAMRNLPARQRKAWSTLFDHYVFDANPCEHIPEHARGVLGQMDERGLRQELAYLANRLNR